MAKKSMIARENKRLKMVEKFSKKRSDLKKIIQWYNILVKQKIIKFDKQIVKRPEDYKKN